MKIILTGSGTGGPVFPLLAVAEEIKKQHPHAEFVFVGTKHGPEKEMVKNAHMRFEWIAAGKLRRYFSYANFIMPFQIIFGFFQSLILLRRENPDCIMGVGGFVQVPVMWAGWILNIPILIHQQDVVPTLANKLCSWCARKITVSLESSSKDFPQSFGLFYKKPVQKIYVTGNPFRQSLKDATKEQGLNYFNLNDTLPVLYVTGGGTGAQGINRLIAEALPELSKVVQIIHQTGQGRGNNPDTVPNYHPHEFIKDVKYAFAAADIVLSRAGMSTITELSNLAKISIIIPMPHSHQEYNGELLAQQQAAIVMHQDVVTPELLVKVIRKLLFSFELQQVLKQNIKELMPHNATQKIADLVVSLAEHS